jgi:hypothetical protein
MSKILLKPNSHFKEVANVSDYLDAVMEWYKAKNIQEEQKSLSTVWYRGMGRIREDACQPGVYRDEFTKRAQTIYGPPGEPERRRLNLEREIHNEFRTIGAQYIKNNTLTEQYFVAQHFGLPTRLLDWTSNPLAALFFAVQSQSNQDGEVIVMEATGIYDEQKTLHATKIPEHVMSMRHPYVTLAVEQTNGYSNDFTKPPLILALRPDNIPGRIGQQSSCFTFHMHRTEDVSNKTLDRIRIGKKGQNPADIKKGILLELHRMNINESTIFSDLDHLCAHLKRNWGVIA